MFFLPSTSQLLPLAVKLKIVQDRARHSSLKSVFDDFISSLISVDGIGSSFCHDSRNVSISLILLSTQQTNQNTTNTNSAASFL